MAQRTTPQTETEKVLLATAQRRPAPMKAWVEQKPARQLPRPVPEADAEPVCIVQAQKYTFQEREKRKDRRQGLQFNLTSHEKAVMQCTGRLQPARPKQEADEIEIKFSEAQRPPDMRQIDTRKQRVHMIQAHLQTEEEKNIFVNVTRLKNTVPVQNYRNTGEPEPRVPVQDKLETRVFKEQQVQEQQIFCLKRTRVPELPRRIPIGTQFQDIASVVQDSLIQPEVVTDPNEKIVETVEKAGQWLQGNEKAIETAETLWTIRPEPKRPVGSSMSAQKQSALEITLPTETLLDQEQRMIDMRRTDRARRQQTAVFQHNYIPDELAFREQNTGQGHPAGYADMEVASLGKNVKHRRPEQLTYEQKLQEVKLNQVFHGGSEFQKPNYFTGNAVAAARIPVVNSASAVGLAKRTQIDAQRAVGVERLAVEDLWDETMRQMRRNAGEFQARQKPNQEWN